MDISAFSEYNRDTMKKFLRFNMFKGKFYKITPYIYGFLVAVFIITSILYQAMIKFDLFMTAATVILTAAYTVQLVMFYYYPTAKLKNRDEKKSASTFYIFRDDSFEYYNSKTGKEKSMSLSYSNLFKVFETKEFFYLYINKKGAFIVDKKTLKEEDIPTVSAVLKEKSGKGKYVKCL